MPPEQPAGSTRLRAVAFWPTSQECRYILAPASIPSDAVARDVEEVAAFSLGSSRPDGYGPSPTQRFTSWPSSAVARASPTLFKQRCSARPHFPTRRTSAPTVSRLRPHWTPAAAAGSER
jgi:hypothetical protein